jgi:dsDNA-binding SOS-regulon protein
MRVVRTVSFVTIFCLCVGLLAGQDKAGAGKSKGMLPANWNKLGLTDDQKAKVYDIQAKYRGKIDDLKKQIADLQEKEQKEALGVLTDAQKTRLKEILANKAGVGVDKK